MKLHFLFLVTLLVTLSNFSFAQDDEEFEIPDAKKKFDWSKVEVGGSFGGGYSNGVFFIDLSPTIGYRVTKRFVPGLGPIYQYYSDSRQDVKIHIYGGRAFARFYVFDKLYALGEYEYTIWNDVNRNVLPFKSIPLQALLFGVGYSQSIGGSANFNLEVLWNVLENQYTYYPNPVIRFGFGVGL